MEKTQKEVTIHDLDPLALTLLVDFSYTGEIFISEDNVQVRLRSSNLHSSVFCFWPHISALFEFVYKSLQAAGCTSGPLRPAKLVATLRSIEKKLFYAQRKHLLALIND